MCGGFLRVEGRRRSEFPGCTRNGLAHPNSGHRQFDGGLGRTAVRAAARRTAARRRPRHGSRAGPCTEPPMNDEVPTDPGGRLALGQGLKLAGVVASMLTITVSKPASAKMSKCDVQYQDHRHSGTVAATANSSLRRAGTAGPAPVRSSKASRAATAGAPCIHRASDAPEHAGRNSAVHEIVYIGTRFRMRGRRRSAAAAHFAWTRAGGRRGAFCTTPARVLQGESDEEERDGTDLSS